MALAIIAVIFLLLSCANSSTTNVSNLPMDAEPASRFVELTPSAPIEYDTSVPVVPTAAASVSNSTIPLLILLYHNITTLTTPGMYDRNINDFENDLQFLLDQGITIIRLSDIAKIQSGEIVPREGERFAVIVFDDGFISAYNLAFPLLKRMRIPATFFLTTSNIGSDRFMTWSEVEEISAWYAEESQPPFFELGSHTVDHRSLAYDPIAFPNKEDYLIFLNMELYQSRIALLPHLNARQTSLFLALPYGDGAYEQEITYAAIRTGYSGSRTTISGAFNASDIAWNYHLPCTVIYGSTDIASILPLYDQLLLKNGLLSITIR